MSTKKRLRRYALCALAALLMTALAWSGVLSTVEATLSDALYQHPRALDGEVVLIGIDEQALDALGPFQTWSRDVLAQAVETLNADPENRPAAIGLDVLFTGETDPAADARLAAAAGAGGNVVTAANAEFGTDVVERADGSFYVDDYAVLAFNEAYPALLSASHQGHINAMYDADGVLRHAIWQVDLDDGRQIPSFNRALYRLYAAQNGLDPAVTPPINARYQWYLPFAATPGDFDSGYSVASLVAGELPPDVYAGKIVLIGPYDAGMQDSYPTAIDRAEHMFGVEYQANAISALLAQDFKTEVPRAPQLILLFLVSFGCLMWFWDRKMLPATIVWLAVCGLSVGACALLYAWGYVLYVLYIPLAATVFFVASVAFNYVRAALAKRQITSTFQRYVAPEIVSELLRGDPAALALGGKLTEIAVLFVDLRGFTTMSENLDAPQVVEILNQYLTLTSDCIFQNGGTLDKFVGDCTMAFWGAPLPQEDIVYRAVKTALDMVRGSEKLSGELRERFGRTVSFGVGVHVGPAVVGNIGAPSRMDYTAIGDTVNTAARLEANAPGGKILVSRAVADALAGRVRFTSLGDSIPLKGKAAGFEVLTADGLMEQEETEQHEN